MQSEGSRTYRTTNGKQLLLCLASFILVVSSFDKSENSFYEESVQSEELISLKVKNSEYLDIVDFENPEAMWLESNKLIYSEAYKRFMSTTILKNGIYFY